MLTIAACKPHSLGPRPYAEYAANPKNGLVMQKKIGSVTYDLKVQPPQVVLAESYNRGMTNIGHDSVQDAINFIFRISVDAADAGKQSALQDNVFIYNAVSSIRVEEGSEPLKLNMSVPENYYGVANCAVLNLSYERPRSKKYKDIVFTYDDESFGLGKIIFTIPSTTLNTLPEIKI
jgi:hypothetical protein